MAAWVGLALLAPVQARQPSPSQKETSKRKARKVWSDEDLQQLRTPADDYAARRQAAEQAAAGQPGSSDNVAPEKEDQLATRDPFIPPKTLAEAETRLAQKREEIRGQQELIRRAREEFFDETSEAIRQDLKRTIGRLTADLKEAELHLKLLETSVEEFRSKPRPQPER